MGIGVFLFVRLEGDALIGGNVLGVDFSGRAAEEAGKEARMRVVGGGVGMISRRGSRKGARGNELRTRFRVALPLAPQLALGKALFPAFGALFTPVAPAVVQVDEIEPAGLNGFDDGRDEDGRGKVDPRGGQHAGYQHGALEIQVMHQKSGDERTCDSPDGPSLPEQSPGQQSQNSRRKGQRQQSTHPAQPGQAAGTRTHPGPSQSAKPQRQE
jgi:hypothetical protein